MTRETTPLSRDALLNSLRRFQPATPGEVSDASQIIQFLETRPDPFNRIHADAHLTGSAVVVDSEGDHVLLGYHRKLGRWLQLGGHGEPGETCGEAVAMREATEESGMDGLQPHPAAPRPLDVDVHRIPEKGTVPAHFHLDLRYVFVAPPGAEPRHRENEHLQMRWFSWAEAEELDLDDALRRLLAKARSLCRR